MTERGLKNINFFIQRLQTFFIFCHVFTLFNVFILFFWNVFYIYGLSHSAQCTLAYYTLTLTHTVHTNEQLLIERLCDICVVAMHSFCTDTVIHQAYPPTGLY